MAEVTKSPNELETATSELQERTSKVARLSEGCARADTEAKDFHAGVRTASRRWSNAAQMLVLNEEIKGMQVRVREAGEQRKERELMTAEDIAAHEIEKGVQDRALLELQRQLETLREQVSFRGRELDEKRRRLLAEKNRFFQSASVMSRKQHPPHQPQW